MTSHFGRKNRCLIRHGSMNLRKVNRKAGITQHLCLITSTICPASTLTFVGTFVLLVFLFCSWKFPIAKFSCVKFEYFELVADLQYLRIFVPVDVLVQLS